MFNNVYGLQVEIGTGKLAGLRREYENYHIEAYLDEVNRRVNLIIKK